MSRGGRRHISDALRRVLSSFKIYSFLHNWASVVQLTFSFCGVHSLAWALGQTYNCPRCSEAALAGMGKVDQAPGPLSIFRSNSKFDENSECSSFEYTRPIATIFCTRHDSDTVVTCAKYRCDRPRVFYTRVFWIFIEFRIRSKYA